MASSNTQRTLDKLRKDGCEVAVVEKWVVVPKHPGGGVRRDLFGLFDILALKPGMIVGIQSTGYSNRTEHLKKMLAEPKLKDWFDAGGRAELWAWKKTKKGKQNRWEPRIQTIEWEPCGPVAESGVMASVSEEVDEAETVSKLEALLGVSGPVIPLGHCPHCGRRKEEGKCINKQCLASVRES